MNIISTITIIMHLLLKDVVKFGLDLWIDKDIFEL